jgi:hypothetical protein
MQLLKVLTGQQVREFFHFPVRLYPVDSVCIRCLDKAISQGFDQERHKYWALNGQQ